MLSCKGISSEGTRAVARTCEKCIEGDREVSGTNEKRSPTAKVLRWMETFKQSSSVILTWARLGLSQLKERVRYKTRLDLSNKIILLSMETTWD